MLFNIINEGKKQFKCVFCGTRLGQKSNLKMHTAILHEGKKQFKCNIFVRLVLDQGPLWTYILQQSMKERSHLNVTFVLLGLE